MVNGLRQIGKKIVGLVFKIIDFIIYISPLYYRSIEKITVRRWFELQSGKFNKLYRINLGYIPKFFYDLYFDLSISFEKTDISLIKEIGNLTRIKSMAARLGDKSMEFQAQCLEKELKAKMKNNQGKKQITMNEFVSYIEITLNSIGMVNVDKMSISRAHYYYNVAIDTNKRIADLRK